jgi:hypothetical protein
MSDNSKVLLLGNGIYRAFHGEEESWDNMLGYVKGRFERDGIVLNIEPSALRSYTLYFEYLYACWKKSEWKSKNEGNEVKMWGEFSGKLQEYLSEKYDSPEYGAYSGYINSLIWKHYNVVLTTNIDNRFEKSDEDGKTLTGGWNPKSGGKTTYSAFRLKVNDQKKIFYMHGSVDKKRSICFGLNHYLGEQKCQYDCLHGLLKLESEMMQQLLTGEVSVNNKKEDQKKSWLYYFLFSDVDIIGQGLSNDEIDIWWVIENRFHYKQIYESGVDKLRNKKKNVRHNTIRYFYPSIEKNKSKVELLRAFDIVPVVIPCSTYREFYKIYFDEFAGENT